MDTAILSTWSGFFLSESLYSWAILGTVIAFLALGFIGAPLWLWTATGAVALFGFAAPEWLWTAYLAASVVFNIKPIRQYLLSLPVMRVMQALKLMPEISATERTALEAGVVWMEAELFSGKPDLKKMLNQPKATLTTEEQSFLDKECEELCAMIDDYEMMRTKQLPAQVFDYMKKKGFLGLIIPKEYGGHGFSPAANSAIVQKISSRSIGAVIYVMVPNSLGPAELLAHYGTQAQKNKYLPRLAKGEEIPCFGLTEPMAGSDAASITSEGVLFKGSDGEIYIRLNWRKRWITLAALSTLIGLAFRLRDPDNLLGRGEDLGITAGLIPSNLPGVMIGKRHDPLGIPFHNCPTEGENVVVKAEDAIIGGINGAGKGWTMLMECLGAGRGISLPAQAAGGTKLCSRVTSNHATIRKQFGMSIGRFEGIEEPLARIAGNTYLTEALRRYVLSALNQHISPPVVTAMAKYTTTEIARQTINDAMDVVGGAGISMGPRNLLASGYIGMPISITVEGANILTRTLMIFGQGALRAHPYAFKELDAIGKNDLQAFDRAFWGHMGHILRNTVRALLLSFSRGRLATSPVGGPAAKYWKMLTWTSASFAILADLAMGMLGGQLKAKQKLTGRFADILSWMFIGAAVLKRWEDEGRPAADLPMVRYSMHMAFHKIQEGFDGIYSNLDVPLIGRFFRGPVRWWSRVNVLASTPRDSLTHKIAHAMLNNQEVRDRLTKGIYMPTAPGESMARLEKTYAAIKQAEVVDKKIRDAIKAKRMPKKKGPAAIEEALKANVITRDEYTMISEAEKMRFEAIQVDEFSETEYVPGTYQPKHQPVKPFETGKWAKGGGTAATAKPTDHGRAV
ncbi:MAG: acyl-CoA dehydrogenase [Bdellovibrionales bacterium]